MPRSFSGWFVAVVVLFGCVGMRGQKAAPTCSSCAVWNVGQAPFRIYGNTYYVGPHGLSSLLIVSDAGLVLIDGALPESAAQIAEHVRALGFRIEDVRFILSSHVHFDHAGGIAELQRLSGATVMASRWSAAVMRGGGVGRDDPQFGEVRPIARVAKVRELRDGEEVHLGKLAMTAHFTPGHTPGGTSWTWKSCEAGRCLHMVYSDSVTAVSRDGYKFTEHPEVVAEFEKSFAFLDTTPCDVLLTAHPEAADLWERMDGHRKGISPDPLIDASGCRRLAETGRKMLEEREQAERR